MSMIAKALPVRLKNSLKVLMGRSLAIPLEAPGMFACPVCGRAKVDMEPIPMSVVRELDRFEHVHSLFQWETCNLEHYSCSHCRASDRDRLYAMHLADSLAADAALDVLDIAPSSSLTAFLKAVYPRLRVRTADLNQPQVDDQVDLTDMKVYREGQFDVFICSHVLEHIPDDTRAMRELYRILKPDGWGIAMVPIQLGITSTHEDPAITDEAGRWKYFGQDDHVRVYAKHDYVKRLEAAGFEVQQLGKDHFGEARFLKCGIQSRAVLYVVRKKAAMTC